MRRSFDALFFCVIAFSAGITPATAGVVTTPVPVAGLGIPALVLFGLAYRGLRNRVGK